MISPLFTRMPSRFGLLADIEEPSEEHGSAGGVAKGLLAGMARPEAGSGMSGDPSTDMTAVKLAGERMQSMAAAAPGSLRRAWEGSSIRPKLQSALDTASYYAGPHLSNRAEAAASVLQPPKFGTVEGAEAGEAFKQGQYGKGAGLMGLGVAGGLLDIPTLGAGGVARGILKGLTKAAHYAPDLGMAVVPAAGKTFWSDLSKTKLPIAVEDMTATRVPTGELLPRKVVSPEALQGSVLMPAVGDRTIAGARLTHINDAPLASPVSLEGGPDFMRAAAAQKEGSAWASDKGVITRLAKQAQGLAETGKDINFVYSSMGARSGDFSHMMSDALLAQLPGAKVPKAVRSDFDATMRAQSLGWPGLDKPEEARQALLKSGPLRKAFVEEMALGKWQNAGFPEVGSTRFAITDPALLGEPTGATGHAISKLDPSGKIIRNPVIPHTTYNTQLGGQGYLGGLERSVPREVMFPDFYKARRAMGAPLGADDRAFTMSNVSQPADQSWLDRLMAYLSQARTEAGAR